MYKVAISIGDTNGIGAEIAIKSHTHIQKYCAPIYCVHEELLESIAKKLGVDLPKDMHCAPPNAPIPAIKVGGVSKDSGRYSYESFLQACKLADEKTAHFITTLPIHKLAWKKAGIESIGHTQALRTRYQKDGIMMLGCEEMFVALFSDHIPLSSVSSLIIKDSFSKFLLSFYHCVRERNIAVLGLNPHCGDGGIMGEEDAIIAESIKQANEILGEEIFIGPISGDSAFSPLQRQRFRYFVAPYHDLGLSALKALYFFESINITLNIPILRTSVDHGVGFDIAYQNLANTQSYINAILLGIKLKEKQ